MNTDTLINNVSDTALWVAHYRALESQRPDALFKDPLAHLLAGKQGEKIARDMKKGLNYLGFTIVMRTVIIDNYIQTMVKEGVDTILNLGAGLDTRPYRMNLPRNLNWIEVDQPQIINHKNSLLANETPVCKLSRFAVDLTDDQKRKTFLQDTAALSTKILVLTEGVIPYLSQTQVSALADDLHRLPGFAYWIVEYLDPRIYPHLKSPHRTRKMKNAPFMFFPDDWTGFFEQRGWRPKEQRYYGVEGAKRGRYMPMPWWAFIFRLLAPKAAIENSRKMAGFLLLERKHAGGPDITAH